MKITYQTCCGVDIHKSFLVATIIKTSGGIEPDYQKKRSSTFNTSILEFKQWLLNNDCRYICMESTGKYWVPVFNLLAYEINVTIANPKWVVDYLIEQSGTSIDHEEIASRLLKTLKSKEDAVIESI